MNNKYELHILNADEEAGLIDLERLGFISSSIIKIAEGALQIRLRGVSFVRGRKKQSLKSSIKLFLSGVSGQEHGLFLESVPFAETLLDHQYDLFQGDLEFLDEATPISLFADSLREAMEKGEESEWLDKPLLRELSKLSRAFHGRDEIFVLSNQGSIPELRIGPEHIRNFKSIEEKIAPPQKVVLNGKVEDLKYSKLRVRIQTEEGMVDAFLTDEKATEQIAAFWGKVVTVSGIAHFRPGGKYIVEIQEIFEPGSGDAYFSRQPVGKTIEEQIRSQVIKEGTQNRLSELIGKWPGEESLDTLLEALKK